MSVSRSSSATTAIRNGNPGRETFDKFFECWRVEQNEHLQDLISVSKDHQNRNNNSTESTQGSDEQVVCPLIDQVVQHYENYYRAKSRWAKHDVFAMLSPSWISSLEDAFLWIGGWRPTMVFHLLYSKSGLQLEARLSELIRGLSTGDLGDLSPTQLTQVDELQRKTIREEKDITEDMAKYQETVADSSMVELSHMVTELIRTGEVLQEDRVESTLESKEEGLEEILQNADDLRLRTLNGVIDILTPIQIVHFLIAAAELHLRLHDWGKNRDAHGTSGTNQLPTMTP